MALLCRYTTSHGVVLDPAYIVCLRPEIHKARRSDGGGPEVNHWTLVFDAAIYASAEAAAEWPNAPVDRIESIAVVANPAAPILAACYAALRGLRMAPPLTRAQVQALDAVELTADEAAALPEGHRGAAAEAVAVKRQALMREWHGDKADGWLPFADAIDA